MIDIWTTEEWKEASAVFGAKRSNPDIIALDKLILDYHKIPGRELEKRVEALDKIVKTGVKFIGEKLDEGMLKNPQSYKRLPAVQQLVAQATAKLKYLEECIEVEDKFHYAFGPIKLAEKVLPEPGDKWQELWAKNINKVNGQIKQATYVSNFKEWVDPDKKGGKYLDESYWTEAIDPLNRNLVGGQMTNALMLFRKWNELRTDDKAPITIGFYRWLEEQDEKDVAALKASKYQDEAGRQKYRIWARAIGVLCKCYDGAWELYDTSKYYTNFHRNGWAIFVIGAKDLELYSDDHDNTDKFYHACFLSGAPVIGAGEIQVREGKLWRISAKSGHYKPGVKEELATLEWFKKKNIPLDKGAEIALPMGKNPDPKADQKPTPTILEWYQADWFLKEKGQMDAKACTIVTENRPLKPGEVRICMMQAGTNVIWDGAKWEHDEKIQKDPWLLAARKNK
ncbi:MAG TPA: hypothetical protein VHF22_02830 [Planctomycetota bacterium]|nr:hypothetical protein [Planctomycetota bacterium]